MKKLKNLGEILTKKEQQAVKGGIFCIIHCLDECLASFGYNDQYNQYCSQNCQDLAAQNGGGGF